jgi:non-ribosomal peptide synthetase component E (peptide arylation enzyme)
MDINLADLCAAVADAVPGRCALVCDGRRLTYRELTARSEQVAQHLVAAGIRPDETSVCTCPTRRPTSNRCSAAWWRAPSQ